MEGKGAMTAEATKFLDEGATARFLNLSPRTLQRMRAIGGGPLFIRAGARRVLYSVAAIEAWAAARQHESRAAELAAQQRAA
jgi:hypothetical protein